MTGETGSSLATVPARILPACRWLGPLWLAAGLLMQAPTPVAAEPLSPRAPLIDVAARAEVDSYRRLDQVIDRSAALPDVFDPAVHMSAVSPLDLRRLVLDYALWLRGAEASHLEMIENLPLRLAQVPTDEPYRDAFIAHYRSSTPERSRQIRAYYEAANSAAETSVRFLELVAGDRASPRPDGFSFRSEADAASYRQLIGDMNRSFADQDDRISAYQSWEIEQKAALRRFRDQL